MKHLKSAKSARKKKKNVEILGKTNVGIQMNNDVWDIYNKLNILDRTPLPEVTILEDEEGWIQWDLCVKLNDAQWEENVKRNLFRF